MTMFKVKKIQKAFDAMGIKQVRRNTHAEIYAREGYAQQAVIPCNHKQDVHVNLLQRELRNIGIDKQDFIKVYSRV